ncbi:MAG: OmpP1/FadL family transporter, partial [Opitutales bacterium]
FTATADNPSAVFYNAAGLTQLDGTELRGNAYLFSPEYSYSSDAFGSAETDDDFQPVPSFFAAHRFDDSPLAIGFGMYAPFGLSLDWGKDAPFAPVAYEARLAYVKYHFVAAWEITERLSAAAGISYDDGELELKSTTGLLGSFEGDGQTLGFSLSLLWQPNEQHAFGLNYQAAGEVDFDGASTTFGSAEANLEFPESIVFGYSWRPNEKWNLEFNLDWTNWDRVNDLTVSSAFPDVPIPQNWESSFIWELGATRYFDHGWHLSGGYTFVENSVPDSDFSPIVPDADRHYFQLGVGRDYESISWQLTYQFTVAPDREVSGSANILPDGTYDLESQGVALSLSYRF